MAGGQLISGRFGIEEELGSGGMAVVYRALALSIVLAFVGERLAPPPLSRILVWPGSVWMGLAFLLVVGLALTDLALLITHASEAGPELLRTRAAVVVISALVVLAVGLKGGLRIPDVARVELTIPRWPSALDGYRVAQLSDLHIGPIRGAGFARTLTERVNALEADLVVLTGDLVDGSVRHVGPQVGPFAELRGRDGVFFVTGNHDMYSGPASWMARVRELGIRVLENEHVVIRRADDCAFTLAGVHDHQGVVFGLPEDVGGALEGAPPNLPTLLLAHDPSTFKAAAGRVDLQLSGHTHGGQIWPFGYLVRLVIPFVAGRYERDGSQLYVSRGTGFWGPPMRLGAPAEITLLTLRSHDQHRRAPQP